MSVASSVSSWSFSTKWYDAAAGLVFKAHRWLYHSTLVSRVIKKKTNRRSVLRVGCRVHTVEYEGFVVGGVR